MILNVIKEKKEVLLFLLMFIAFTFFASMRVDNLESNSVYSAKEEKMVYNK